MGPPRMMPPSRPFGKFGHPPSVCEFALISEKALQNDKK
jgi:hypothetical protein